MNTNCEFWLLSYRSPNRKEHNEDSGMTWPMNKEQVHTMMQSQCRWEHLQEHENDTYYVEGVRAVVNDEGV